MLKTMDKTSVDKSFASTLSYHVLVFLLFSKGNRELSQSHLLLYAILPCGQLKVMKCPPTHCSEHCTSVCLGVCGSQ